VWWHCICFYASLSPTELKYINFCSGAFSLEKPRRAAFDITSQHEATFSLYTRNRPLKFAMLPKYLTGKFRQYSVYWQYLLITAAFLHGVFGNPSCYLVSNLLKQIPCPVPYGVQPSHCIK